MYILQDVGAQTQMHMTHMGGEGRGGEGLTSVCGRVGTDSGRQGMEERQWMLFHSHVQYAGERGSCKGITIALEGKVIV